MSAELSQVFGAYLSRHIARIVLTALLERFEGTQLAPGGRLSSAGMLGIKHLPIVFHS